MYPAQRVRGTRPNKSGVGDPMAGEVKVDAAHRGDKEKSKHANKETPHGQGSGRKGSGCRGMRTQVLAVKAPIPTATSGPLTVSPRSTWAAMWTSYHPHNR